MGNKGDKKGFLGALLGIGTSQPVMPGVATTAVAFNRDIPRRESTVVNDLAYAGALLASPAIIGNPRGVLEGALSALEYSSPSHWTGKAAARLALPLNTARKLGLYADYAVPATSSVVSGIDSARRLGSAVSEQEKEAARNGIRSAGLELVSSATLPYLGNHLVSGILPELPFASCPDG